MGKGNNIRGNKETRKPKAEKPKASATANSTAGKPDLTIARKKVKQNRRIDGEASTLATKPINHLAAPFMRTLQCTALPCAAKWFITFQTNARL